jgi:hypothetical protein
MNPGKRQRLSLSKNKASGSPVDKLNATQKSNSSIIDLFKKQLSKLDSVLVDSSDASKHYNFDSPVASDICSHDDLKKSKGGRLSLKRTNESPCGTAASSMATRCSVAGIGAALGDRAGSNLVYFSESGISVNNCIGESSNSSFAALDVNETTAETFQLGVTTGSDTLLRDDHQVFGNETTSAELEVVKNSEDVNGLTLPFMPYYLESFLLVVDTILSDAFYSYLFSDEDHVAVHAFRFLPG